MDRRTLTRASLGHYLPTNAMVVAGIAAAVAVLAGALLVGASVRDSLRELALGRLGATDLVLSAPTFFRTALADSVLASPVQSAAPLIVMSGAVVHDESKRTAGRVAVYGIDDRFERFHGITGRAVDGRNADVSAALARELGVREGDSLTLRVARPTDIPLSTLQGRRELSGDRFRVTVARVLEQESLSQFSLVPAQGPVLAIFVPMTRLQRDLELGDRVNTILLKVEDEVATDRALAMVRTRVSSVATVDDAGLRVRPPTSGGPLVIEGKAGFIPPAAVEIIANQAADQARSAVPVLTYVANAIRIGSREVPYSTVSGIDLGGPRGGVPSGSGQGSGAASSKPPIWLNEWAATDLMARTGDDVT